MAKEVRFNVKRPSYESIVNHHEVVRDSLINYFSEDNPDNIGFTPGELNGLIEENQLAQEKQDSLALLAFLEATFRVDYISRKRLKLKDSLSKSLIKIFNRKRYRAALVDDIIKTWLRVGTINHSENQRINESMQVRHWLAHGQYWARDGVVYKDFYDIATLVEGLINSKVFQVAPDEG
ncbi:hypothetical protein VC290_21325 [Xanthomonas campestris]|uniref:hypothetical protein n=1 Tax=Xanthomonas campestris TaxID=339 RepID=UPI002B225846|nr:hypothetical protein [Xanthomonas campestris]MEA9482813.1 hypothetical protein [Xanthomonas campestris]